MTTILLLLICTHVIQYLDILLLFIDSFKIEEEEEEKDLFVKLDINLNSCFIYLFK